MRRALVILPVLAALLAVSCTNEPFDPESVPNAPPVMRFFASPVDPADPLNPTSYFRRTFHWSGSDQDGEVVEYYVSIRTDAAVPAPWDTTARTDTTMTFSTDDQGEAEATFYLACRDDRGAVSDTLVQFVPLRNFPPVLNFQSDFNPLVNLQREIELDGGGAPVDTVYWNWGVMNLRCFAFDLDGNSTMDPFYRYTLSDAEPTETRDWDDPAADPLVHWLRKPFDGSEDINEFEILLTDVPPGQRTVTVAVADEALAETRVTLSWEVRAPRGQVLMVPDNSSPFTQDFYRGVLDEILGTDAYDTYDFWFGFPDSPAVLLATLRKFGLVFWYDGGGTSAVLERAAATGGVLKQYVYPLDDSQPGHLLLISRNLAGSATGLPGPFLASVFGISRSADPPTELSPKSSAVGLHAFGTQSYLPDLTIQTIFGRGRGLQMRYDETDAYDELYRFDTCNRCWNGQPANDPQHPELWWQPLIAVRRPTRAQQEFARAVGFSYELHTLQRPGVVAALEAVMQYELGVIAP
ncbi:MAG: hypothetical protein R3D98_02475 [Candidatus Krumholzibacteriia bacterium]